MSFAIRKSNVYKFVEKKSTQKQNVNTESGNSESQPETKENGNFCIPKPPPMNGTFKISSFSQNRNEDSL